MIEWYTYGAQEAFLALQNKEQRLQNGDEDDWVLRCSNFYQDEQDEDNLWWGRFVTHLDQSSMTPRGELYFSEGFFDRPDDEVLERLFREVLPYLQSVHLNECQILPVYIDLLAKSLLDKSTGLEQLDFCETVIDSEGINTIAQMLRTNANGIRAPIEFLSLKKCSIDSNRCDVILRALHGNTWLRRLDLSDNQISEISLEAARALGNNKKLFKFNIQNNPLTVPSLCHLAEGLRTNHSLDYLIVQCDNIRLASDAFADLLKTFNYRLVVVHGDFHPRLDVLIHHNIRIRQLHDHLLERNRSSRYHLSQVSLWPMTLECVRNKPCLIYRFLRHGNLDSFTNQVNPVSKKQQQEQEQQRATKSLRIE